MIVPIPLFQGVEQLLNNRNRIDALSNGKFSFNYLISDVKSVTLHLAHMNPSVNIGDELEKSDTISEVNFDQSYRPKKVAYVIYIRMKDGSEWQFGPCDVPNDDEFCGKCTSGSPYCPYRPLRK